MIKFLCHRAARPHKVVYEKGGTMFSFKIKKGQKILKVLFEAGDIHMSNSGKWHLDIWGSKLKALKDSL